MTTAHLLLVALFLSPLGGALEAYVAVRFAYRDVSAFNGYKRGAGFIFAGAVVWAIASRIPGSPIFAAGLVGLGVGVFSFLVGSGVCQRLLSRMTSVSLPGGVFPTQTVSPADQISEIDRVLALRARLLGFLATTTADQRAAMVALLSENQAEELTDIMSAAAADVTRVAAEHDRRAGMN